MEGTSQVLEANNENENLLLRRTQGDLLQKLRQLQQWRQQQEEHLQQDKEKQLSLLRDKERRLHAVQEYQRKILQNNNVVSGRMDVGPLHQVKPTGFHEEQSSRTVIGMQPSKNMAMSYSRTGYNPPAKTVLLSPQHFTSSNKNAAYISPVVKPHNQMLLTQKVQLPSTGDDELSQFTESDGGSIGAIEGIRPIEDTPSELSAATDDEENFSSDGADGNNDTMVHRDHHQDERNDNDVNNNDHDIDYSDDINQDDYDHDTEDDDLEQDNDDHDIDDDDHDIDDDEDYRIDQKHNDHGIDDIDQDSDHDIEDNDGQAARVVNHGVNSKPTFDDIPIKPGLGGQTRTFEELLNQQLEAEQQNSNHEEEMRSKIGIAAKRTFLKKGEGLARFGVRTKTVTEPVASKEHDKDIVEQKAPVTRKTATVKDYTTSKQSAMPRVTEAAVKPKSMAKTDQMQLDVRKLNASKSSTGRQTMRPVIGSSLSYESDQEKHPFSPKKVQFNTKQPRHVELTEDIPEEDLENSSEDGGLEEVEHHVGGSEVIIEDSFQERMKKWDALEVVEKQELNEFELLEEAAAANCSLSSNSSTVLRILGKKQEQSRADVNNNLTGARQKLDLVRKGVETLEVYAKDANRTLTEENLDDDDGDDDTLQDSEVTAVRSSLALSDGFDDTKTWDENNALDVSDVNDDVLHALNTSTPDEKVERRSAHAQNTKMVPISSTPPTSALVKKLFPQLKATKCETTQLNQNRPMPQQSAPPAAAFRLDADDGLHSGTNPFRNSVMDPGLNIGMNSGLCSRVNSGANSEMNPVLNPAMNSGLSSRANSGLNSETNPGLNSGMSNAVRDKLQELEKEIEKFREENVALHRLREEREKDLQELQREKTLFENYKTEEVQRLEKFKTEEEKRLRRDKRVFEQYQKASRALPDKKEREEITLLKRKISELQEDLKLRESRWSAAAVRYKDRISNLEQENREMKEEVKLLEKQNLDLQRKEQQKIRELQQYKAFEKKKLKKSEEKSTEEEPTVRSPISKDLSENVKGKYQDIASEVGILKSVPTNVASDESETTHEHATAFKTRKIEDEKGITEETQSAKHSPPTKQVSSPKNVRFKDDVQRGEEKQKRPESLPKQLSHSDGKRETINPDGSRVVTFTNGTRKEISADGLSVIVTFFNGDVKQIYPDDRVEYYYAEVQTTHTTYPDGLEVLHFPSNQIEKHYPDGTKEIIFPDQTVKYLYTSGAEECVFTDGTVERIGVDGERIVEFPNGQRETYTKLFKKREYPDGTVKTVYTDGRQETRYASGRLRVKDSEGRLLVDTAEQNVQTQQGVAT